MLCCFPFPLNSPDGLAHGDDHPRTFTLPADRIIVADDLVARAIAEELGAEKK